MPLWTILAALAVPLLVWFLWYRSERVIYRGAAVLLPFDEAMPRVRSDRVFVIAALLGDQRVVVETSVERARTIPPEGKSVELEIRARRAARIHVESIVWNAGEKPEKADQRFDGLLIAGYFLVLGVWLLTTAYLPCAAIALVLSGFLTGGVLRADVDYTRLAPIQLLAMFIWLILSGWLTVVLFQERSILLLFPGILLAFSFGQLLGMFGLYRGQKERAAKH